MCLMQNLGKIKLMCLCVGWRQTKGQVHLSGLCQLWEFRILMACGQRLLLRPCGCRGVCLTSAVWAYHAWGWKCLDYFLDTQPDVSVLQVLNTWLFCYAYPPLQSVAVLNGAVAIPAVSVSCKHRESSIIVTKGLVYLQAFILRLFIFNQLILVSN